MSYIQKDTNFKLLILLVSIMIIIGILTVFYQVSFKAINTKYGFSLSFQSVNLFVIARTCPSLSYITSTTPER